VAARSAASSAAAAPPPVRPARPGRVLVVDDVPGVAEVVAEAIGRGGHRVDTASDGAEALRALERERYDVVVSDTKMPVLDGQAFYAELHRRFPELRRRILFLTGDVLSAEKRHFLEETGAPFLAKPCDMAELREVVERMLTAAP
jgi:CheY-like chemotaxis protein